MISELMANSSHEVAHDLSERLTRLSQQTVNCDDIRLKIADALIKRARDAKPEVQRVLMVKAEKNIDDFETSVHCKKIHDGVQSAPAQQDTLMALMASIQPTLPEVTEKSRGVEFDEYLLQQESNILQSLVDADQAAVAASSSASSIKTALSRSGRYQKHSQLQKSADRLVNIAIEQSPENPGPLNPDMLSIKALKLLRDLSPQYLNRFVAYIDSLIWIEEAAGVASPQTVKSTQNKPRKGKASDN